MLFLCNSLLLSWGLRLFRIKAITLCKVPQAIRIQGLLFALEILPRINIPITRERSSFEALELIGFINNE